jgi:hypothetical protein
VYFVQKAALEAETSRRQELYRQRFQLLGWWFVHRFRKIKFVQGLQTAFETPSMYSIQHVDQTFWIPKRQYFAAWTYVIETDYSVMTKREFETFLKLSWDMFDVAVCGKMDYRELLGVWSLFQIDWRTSTTSYLSQCFRNYVEPGELNLGRTEILQVLLSLCTTEVEAGQIVKHVNWNNFPSISAGVNSGSEEISYQGLSDPDAPYLLGIERELANVESKRGYSRREVALAKRKKFSSFSAPSSSTQLFSVSQFRAFLQNSSELVSLLDGYLVACLPAVLRSSRQRHLVQNAIRTAEKHVVQITNELALRDAMLMWSHHALKRIFAVWKDEIGRDILLRRKEVRFMRIRAIRRWNAWTAEMIEQKTARQEAEEHAAATLVDNTFCAWAQRTITEKRISLHKRKRAEQSHRFTLKENHFFAWLMQAQTTKAYMHLAMVCKRRSFKAWSAAMATLTFERKQADEEKAVRATVARGKEVLSMLKIGDEDLQAEALEEIQRAEAENERIKAELEWSKIEEQALQLAQETEVARKREREAADAERRLRLSQQKGARQKRLAREKGQMESQFAEKWVSRFKDEELLQRAKAEAVVKKGKDKDVRKHIAEVTKELLTGSGGVTVLQQPFSVYEAHQSEEENGILLRHIATGETLSTEGLTKKDARKIAAEHAVGKLLSQAMVQLQAEREADHDFFLRQWAGRVVLGAFLKRKWRKALLHQLRAVTQQLIDPDSGNLYFYDVRTGHRSSEKPGIFRQDVVHPLPMAWRRNDADSGGSIYCLRRMPWQKKVEPPTGYRLCMSCGVEFADRLCAGEGCHDFAYCFHCWISHHPYDDELFSHLSNVKHIAVDRARCQHFTTEYATIQSWAAELNFGVFSEKGFYAACSARGVNAAEVESTDL